MILLAATLLVGTCFVDDRIGLSPVVRLLVQVVAASLVVLGGTQILEVSNPFEVGVIELGVLGLFFSVFWIVALTNLMNFLDGVSGLSSGVSSVGFLILLMLSILPGMHTTDQSLVQVFALILFVIAFLSFLFEFPSPKFLIGDSGTMFFGFMLAVLAMLNGGKLATAALVLLIPLFDGAWVILRRVFSRKSPFKGDMGHLHHRLERLGFSKEAILFIYIGISFLFGLIAVFVWNTFFKVLSLLLLLSALSVTGYAIWIKETK
jgi:UDP-GlcNAc:undecaprenyl-phosphate GlcNAc-1-phosphate transferase